MIDELIVIHIGTVNRSQLNQKLLMLSERLKQKLVVYAGRFRRYSKAELRRKHNYRFKMGERKLDNTLKSNINKCAISVSHPEESDFSSYWENIWSIPKSFNKNAFWLKDIYNEAESVPIMDNVQITAEDVHKSIKSTHNWKAPGPDKI